MKSIKKRLLVLVLGFSASFVKAESQQGSGTQPIGSYSQMQKKVGYPTPSKERLQKMLQKFVGEFEGRAFKMFSEEDFNRGYLLYRQDDPNKNSANHVLQAILWYTQNSKIFNKEMRSWYQRYGEKVYAATNAIGMTDDFLWYHFGSDNGRLGIDWGDTGIVHPYMLRTREAAYVALYLDRLKRVGNTRPTSGKNDENVITIVLGGGKKIVLVVTLTAISIPTLR